MKEPLLTVCLITYNHFKYIRQSIDSILEQQADFHWQLIIADDFSTDGTRDILVEYQRAYPDRIKLILQKKNVGPEENWMGLLQSAKSEYVLYCEGDDFFTDSNKLQMQVDYLNAHKDYALCFHPVKVFYEGGLRDDEIFPTEDQLTGRKTFSLADLLSWNFMQANSVMYRWRFINENVRDVFPKSIIPGDWFLHLLHAEKGKIGFIEKEMAAYRRHRGGVWWSGLNNPNAFWEKYGIGHLAFYSALLNKYGADKRYRPIIESSIVDLCGRSIEVDAKQHSTIIEDTVSSQPALIVLLVTAQYEIIMHCKQSIKEGQERIDVLEQELRALAAKHKYEIDKIYASRSFKVGYLTLHPWKIPKSILRLQRKDH